MKVTRLSIKQFRNLSDIFCEPSEGVNVIYGENGHGKTNLLEAIWLFTGGRSFRNATFSELIPIGQDRISLEMAFSDFNRQNVVNINLGEKREILYNSVPLDSFSALSGNFCCVVFSPMHLNLIKGGPSERRKALDAVIGQIKPRYLMILQDYQKLLLQRNALLKDILFSPSLIDTLDIWDLSLAKMAALIIKTRKSFLSRLLPLSQEIYNGISSGREKLYFSYDSTAEIDGDSSEETLLSLLKQRRGEDIKNGVTSAGPHRDDFIVDINGISARAFGSQGQQRSAVLALKLGECALIEQVTGQSPVVLLDDVMSELDEMRRDFLLHRLNERQIFITCCDSMQVVDVNAAFKIVEGKIFLSKKE